jgi:alkyl hydroperoxide reductase subunit F
MYDLIIIGGGPAGTAAAVYAARKQLTTALITPEFGGQSIVSETIYNWIGTPEISGPDLAKLLKQHVEYYKGPFLEIFEGEYVTGVTKNIPTPTLPQGEGELTFTVTTNKQSIQAKSVLVTTGSSRRKLEIPGADQFENRGVVYCASCDGPLFSGQDVVVVGGGNAAFESAAQLAAYCSHVTLIHRRDTFKADEITVSKVSAMPNVAIKTFVEPTEILGEKFVTGIKVRNTQTNQEETIPCGGVFVEIGQIPNTDYVKDLVKTNEYGNIEIDPWTQASSCPGIWAAGDCTNVHYHQNNIAAGDAVKALEDIYVTLKTK